MLQGYLNIDLNGLLCKRMTSTQSSGLCLIREPRSNVAGLQYTENLNKTAHWRHALWCPGILCCRRPRRVTKGNLWALLWPRRGPSHRQWLTSGRRAWRAYRMSQASFSRGHGLSGVMNHINRSHLRIAQQLWAGGIRMSLNQETQSKEKKDSCGNFYQASLWTNVSTETILQRGPAGGNCMEAK